MHIHHYRRLDAARFPFESGFITGFQNRDASPKKRLLEITSSDPGLSEPFVLQQPQTRGLDLAAPALLASASIRPARLRAGKVREIRLETGSLSRPFPAFPSDQGISRPVQPVFSLNVKNNPKPTSPSNSSVQLKNDRKQSEKFTSIAPYSNAISSPVTTKLISIRISFPPIKVGTRHP